MKSVNSLINKIKKLEEKIQQNFDDNDIINTHIIPFEELILNKELTIETLEKLYYYLVNKCNFLKKFQNNNKLLIFLCCIFKFVQIKNNNFVYHLGSQNSNIYFLLNGKCKILLSKEKEVDMTEEEYLLFISKLYYYGEKELFKRTIINSKFIYGVSSYYNFDKFILDYIEKNKDIYIYPDNIININIIEDNEKKYIPDKYLMSLLIKINKKISKKSHYLKPSIINNNYNEYINRIYPIFLLKESKEENDFLTKHMRRKCLISYYIIGDNISKGEYFNEQFTKNNSENIAVLSIDDNSYFGVLSNDYFKYKIINDNFFSSRKINTDIIYNHPLFKGIDKDIFINNYSKRFKFNVEYKGHFLFKNGDVPLNIFFLKKGIVEIIYKDKILSLYDSSDLIGAENFYNVVDNEYIFSARVKSEVIEYFTLSNYEMKKMLNENKVIKSNYDNYIFVTRKLIVNKIKNLIIQAKEEDRLLKNYDNQYPKQNREFLIKFPIINKEKKSYSGPKNLKTLIQLKNKSKIIAIPNLRIEKIKNKDEFINNLESFDDINPKNNLYKLYISKSLSNKKYKKKIKNITEENYYKQEKNNNLIIKKKKSNSINKQNNNNISLNKEIKMIFNDRLPNFKKIPIALRNNKLNKILLSNRSNKSIFTHSTKRNIQIIKLNEMTKSNYEITKTKIEKSY